MSDPTPQEELDRIAVGRSLRLEKFSEIKEHEHRLNKIIEWAKSKGAATQEDVLGEIVSLRHRLGSPTIYELMVYTGLEMERLKDEQALQEAKRTQAMIEAKNKERDAKMKKFEAKERRNEKGQFVA